MSSYTTSSVSELPIEPPKAHFSSLETLWFQVAGTLCNLRCEHCFISCSPDNRTLKMMKTQDIFCYLDQAKELGVKEIYYTGGEPFLHQDFLEILGRTLQDFPVSVLTNGLPINNQRADRLEYLYNKSCYSLEIRISLDDYDEKRNDAVRGKGTFLQALNAYKRLYDRSLLPILTVSEIGDYLNPEEIPIDSYKKYIDLLQSIGVKQPRIKIIPVFEMGMLPIPEKAEKISSHMMTNYDHSLLQCSSSRMIAADGIYACPILVGEKKAKMSQNSLQESLKPCSLYHTACHTCYLTGMTCRNF